MKEDITKILIDTTLKNKDIKDHLISKIKNILMSDEITLALKDKIFETISDMDFTDILYEILDDDITKSVRDIIKRKLIKSLE